MNVRRKLVDAHLRQQGTIHAFLKKTTKLLSIE